MQMAVPEGTQIGFASAGVERPLAMGMTSASSPVTGMPAVATEASAHCNYVPTGVIFVMPSGETIVGRRCQDLAQEQESRRRNARPTVTLHNASPNSSFRVTGMPRSPIYREEVMAPLDMSASNIAFNRAHVSGVDSGITSADMSRPSEIRSLHDRGQGIRSNMSIRSDLTSCFSRSPIQSQEILASNFTAGR